MPAHYSLAYLQSEHYTLTAHCEAPGDPPCNHSQRLNWDDLIAAFGPDFVIPKRRDEFLSRLRCSKCGGRRIGIILTARGGYGG